jgi:hypothetical protein
MQPMNEPPPATERSRRHPPRRRSDEPIPIPEATTGARRTKTVKLHQVLQAYQRAVLDVVEKRMAEVTEAASEATRRAVAEALHEAPPRPDRTDVAKGALAFADERFQAMSLRLQQVDQALRRLVTESPASPPTPGPNGDLAARLDAIAEAVGALAADHRDAVEELSRRTGQGVVAVARVLRDDLQGLGEDLARLREGMDGVQGSVRSMHRTLAWEGMRTGQSRQGHSPPT